MKQIQDCIKQCKKQAKIFKENGMESSESCSLAMATAYKNANNLIKEYMNRKTIIIVSNPGHSPEAWGNLKKLCLAKGWKYNTLSKIKEIPICHEGCYIYRVPFL